MPKPLCQEVKEVASLITYFERERDFGAPLLPPTSVRERVAEVLQLSLGSGNRISADVHVGNALCSPKKTHPYHSTLENKTQLLKPQLLQKVSQNKPPKSYVADKLALTMGHKVLRLPPYHCMFNPIEHVWGIAKTYYNKHAGRDGRSTEHCIALWRESLGTVTTEIWANCVKHTEKEILIWWDREKHLDTVDVAPLIINTQDSSDESELESIE